MYLRVTGTAIAHLFGTLRRLDALQCVRLTLPWQGNNNPGSSRGEKRSRPPNMTRRANRFSDMKAYPKTNLKAAVAIIFTVAVMIAAIPSEERPTETAPVSLSIEPEPRPAPAATPKPVVPEIPWVDVEVRSADSLARIFDRVGLPPADLQRLMTAGPVTKGLKRLLPGISCRYTRTLMGS